MKQEYVRCKNCATVYEDRLDKCPNCGSPTEISEGQTNTEPVFNILD